MKIEMGESLLYSWLRHVKECQIVQTNWAVSQHWKRGHEETIAELMKRSDTLFSEKYGYKIYKNNGLEQLIQQAETDVLGIAFENGSMKIYAVDVAFHEDGLNYGNRVETAERVIKKCLRSAMCIYSYFDCTDGEIVFATPKMQPSTLQDLTPCMDDMNDLLQKMNLQISCRIIANEDFESLILTPILTASEGISDTTELFIRSYQMFNMFSGVNKAARVPRSIRTNTKNSEANEIPSSVDSLKEMKVGRIAQTVLRKTLESGVVSKAELDAMQTAEYSKRTFDLQFPLLVEQGSNFDKVRYYAKPLKIDGRVYYLCSQWFEVSSNDDKSYLLKWLARHAELS